MTPARPQRRWRARLLALAAGLALLAAALYAGNEHAKRLGFGRNVVFDYDTTPPDLIWRHLPDQHFLNPDPTWIDINGYGLRDPDEVRIPKPAGVFRIVSLGDSFTYGLRIPFEKTYTRRLEELLRARPGLEQVEVWNAGTNGYTSCQERAWLEHYGLALEPDVVTVGFVMNDVIPVPPESVPRRVPGRQLLLRWPLFQWLVKRGHERRAHQRDRSDDERWIREYQGQVELYPSSSERARALWDDALNCLRELTRSAHAAGAAVVLIVFPSIVQMNHPRPEPEPQALLRTLAEEEGLIFVDLLPTYSQLGKEALLDDLSHPSVRGNEIAAVAIARALLEAGLVPEGE